MSIIYVLTNPAMPGMVKIGYTIDLKQHLRGLDSTSVPLPFRCEYALQVSDSLAAEKLLHDAFGDRRIRDNREFFEVDASRVIAAMKLTGGEEVAPSDDVASDEAGIAALAKPSKRKADVNFEMVGLAQGTELYFVADPSMKATVLSKWRVMFEGEDTSMSKSAKLIHERRGKTWKSVNGANFWSYDGETISERRNRLDREAAEADED